MDGWKIVSFWDGFLAGAMLVSGSVLIKDVFLEVEQSKISSTAMGCKKKNFPLHAMVSVSSTTMPLEVKPTMKSPIV